MIQNQQNNYYPLGPLENLFREVSDNFDGDGASGLVFRIQGNLRPDLMGQALFYLQRRHPKLRCCIEFNTAGVPCFKVLDSCPPIPLSFQSATSDDLRWQDIAQTVLYPAFDTLSGPLIRIVVLENMRSGMTDLLIGFHHAIFDGISGTFLVHELLSAYEKINNHQQQLPNDVPQLAMITGRTLPVTASLPKRMRSICSLLGFIMRRRWGGGLTKLPSSSGLYSPLIERHILSVEQSERIIMRCREHEVSLSGAMFAAGLISLNNISSGYKKKFSCRFPIDLRGPSGYKVDPEHLGCMVSGFMKIYSLTPDVKFWDLARKGQHDIKQFLEDQGPLVAVKLSRFRKIKAGSPPPQRDSLAINNLGILNINHQYGELGLEEMSLITRRRFVGVSLLVFFHTLNGRLNITFDGVDLSKEFYVKFQKEFINLLTTVISRIV